MQKSKKFLILISADLIFCCRETLHIIYSKDCRVHPPPEIKQRLEDLDEIERCQKMSYIDSIFLKLFPLAFLVFNLIYWPYWVMVPDENGN